LTCNPYLGFGRGIHCEFGEHGIILSRPKVAIRIAECIAEWTEIETLKHRAFNVTHTLRL